MRFVFALAACLPSFAFADAQAVIDQHITPGYAKFAETASQLAETARNDCGPEAVLPAYHDTFDAWLGVSHITFGPVEKDGRGFAISFWPDPKDRVAKGIGRLVSVQDPVVNDPEAFASVSVAAQGLNALERLLIEPPEDADYACALVQAVSTALARNAATLNQEWPEYAALMVSPGNARFQSAEEVDRAIYTALSTGLEFLYDARLGRPLGTFDRPRPRRAETYRSARAQRNVVLNLAALQDLTMHFADTETPETMLHFETALTRAEALDDPDFSGVANPGKRIKIESIQSTVRELRIAVDAEIGAPMGISAGFNALDGD
ncbi:MAG: imelysin family protein [Pseudomonadota bacterium]